MEMRNFMAGCGREGQKALVLERDLQEGTEFTTRGRGLQKRIWSKWRVEPVVGRSVDDQDGRSGWSSQGPQEPTGVGGGTW
jgi:hypothetical protein